jgi:hypothetical protein
MKTTTLNLGKTADQYRKAFKKQAISISSSVDDILSKLPKQKEKKISIGFVTVADLGFTENPTTTELYARIKGKGYDLSPAEVGPALRLAYMDQPKGEGVYIAMDPIPDSGGHPDVFAVGLDGGGELLLRDAWTDPGGRWRLGDRIVFRLRKSSELKTSEKHSDTLPLALDILTRRIERLEKMFNPELLV